MPAPQRVAVDIEAQTVTIDWADETQSVLTLDVLRRACPCATCKRRREQGGENAWSYRTWTDVQVEAVGSYGLRFDWDDGHNDGIYTWSHLHTMAAD